MCSLMMISDMLSKHVGAVKSVLKKWFKINDIQLVRLLVVWWLVNLQDARCNNKDNKTRVSKCKPRPTADCIVHFCITNKYIYTSRMFCPHFCIRIEGYELKIIDKMEIVFLFSGPRWLSRCCNPGRAGVSGDGILVGAKFSAPVKNGPGAHTGSCTMGTRLF